MVMQPERGRTTSTLRLADHAPHVRTVGRYVPLAAHREPEMRVVGHVLDGLGLEIHRQALSITLLDDRADDERAEALALPMRVGGEQVQVPMWFGRRVGGDDG